MDARNGALSALQDAIVRFERIAEAAGTAGPILAATSPSFQELLAVAAVAFLTSLCYGITGFGQNMAVQCMWYILTTFGWPKDSADAYTASFVAVALWSWAMTGVQAALLREHLNRQLGLALGISASFFTVTGLLVLGGNENTSLKVAFGIVFLLFFVWRARVEWLSGRLPSAETMPPFQVNRATLPLVLGTGAVVGLMATLFISPGPPMMVFVLFAHIGRDEHRSTVAFASSLFWVPARLLVLLGLGINLQQVQWHAIAGCLGGLVGMLIGNRVSRYVTQAQFRNAVLLLLSCAGLSFVFEGTGPWPCCVVVIGMMAFLLWGAARSWIQTRRSMELATRSPGTEGG